MRMGKMATGEEPTTAIRLVAQGGWTGGMLIERGGQMDPVTMIETIAGLENGQLKMDTLLWDDESFEFQDEASEQRRGCTREVRETRDDARNERRSRGSKERAWACTSEGVVKLGQMFT